jgi:3-hydroxy-3-methylglutaryl CoA synthase
MSVAELKKSLLALPLKKRHEFVKWAIRQETQVPLTDEDVCAMTAMACRELDEREAEDEKRKTR